MSLRPAHRAAVLQALLVTLLWSSSFVLIRIGLLEIPALTFAGIRYSLGFLCLLPVALHGGHIRRARDLSSVDWLRLVGLGLLFYAMTQGTVFLALAYLRPVTMSMVMSYTPAMVALLGIPLLHERPGWLQWAGIGIFLIGAAAFFLPFDLAGEAVPPDARGISAIGLAFTVVCLIANSGSSILGRYVNFNKSLSPVGVTTISMGIGAPVMLIAGIATQGIPPLSPGNWVIIGCLAVVNTAFAFSLWNHTLRSLTATESSVINNTMLIQIAVLGWVFLGDALNGREIAGLLVAAAGAVIVQLRP